MKLIMEAAEDWTSSSTAALPSDLDIPDGMGDPQDVYGPASVFVFLAMFGGSTFILFLLCYFCQKKLQDEENGARSFSTPPRQIYVIPTTNRLQVPSTTIPSMPSPPPDYGSVVKKEIPAFRFDCEPPSYETAICFDISEIETENDPDKIEKRSPVQKDS